MLQKVHPHARQAGRDAEDVTSAQPRLLMCEPAHFAINYSINPWMEPAKWAAAAHSVAVSQWSALHDALAQTGAAIEKVAPRAGLPDLVFTANAAVVLDRTALMARFRYPERQGEEPVFTAAFEGMRKRGLIERLVVLPEGVVLEGAGDCLFDEARNLFWMGFGQRSEGAAAAAIEATFGLPVVSLQLADPRFYHLDTAFCPLPSGDVIYYPGAFTDEGRAAIAARVSEKQRVVLDEAEAAQFSANAVCVGRTIAMSRCSDRLRGELAARGYDVVATPLDTFLQSGGSAACLTLRLDRCSASRSP
ncbi:arginine deiminase-related protein [Bradyrhizobium sp. LHD-71]|uniref:dimethylarginine dimethylaminohydrolase family protein n=1 Tax=Bradyrhizobium sp. LHD-71 TaxID=3072141 RepID=UPI00280FFB04|nr:arginine deiminase-related protein [Bradyrhizobium sp. LHD-71]MDQ8728124.1 arginine deiminase-related protein [Bradyrhizobium sp. LHD-71]